MNATPQQRDAIHGILRAVFAELTDGAEPDDQTLGRRYLEALDASHIPRNRGVGYLLQIVAGATTLAAQAEQTRKPRRPGPGNPAQHHPTPLPVNGDA